MGIVYEQGITYELGIMGPVRGCEAINSQPLKTLIFTGFTPNF